MALSIFDAMHRKIWQRARPLHEARASFQSFYYLRHNQRRLEHLASLGLILEGRRVLELGAGIGDMTGFFLDRGCSVVSVEPRADCVAILSDNLKSYGFAGDAVTVIQADAYNFPQRVVGRFDVVFAYGLLYHLNDPATAIHHMATACNGLLLLETCVSFGDTSELNKIAEPSENQSQAIEGVGCRPTRPYVWNLLKQHFTCIYTTRTQPAHPEFPRDWDDPTKARGALHRAIFVASHTPLDNPQLLDALPRRQPLAA
jgi:SAM-dependent methyltransferase